MYFVIKTVDGFYAGISPTGRIRNVHTLSGACILSEYELCDAMKTVSGIAMGINLFEEPDTGTVHSLQNAVLNASYAEALAYLRTHPYSTSTIRAREWVEDNKRAMSPAIKSVCSKLSQQGTQVDTNTIIEMLLSDGVGDPVYYNSRVPYVVEQLCNADIM